MDNEDLKNNEDAVELLKAMDEVKETKRAFVLTAAAYLALIKVISDEDALDDIPNFEEKVKSEVDEMDPIAGYSHSDIKDFDEDADRVVGALAKALGQ